MNLQRSVPSLQKWLADNHQDALVEADRELVRRGGFRSFVKLAWHVLEPMTPLKWNWAMDVICDHVEAGLRGDILRLLVNVPPGLMKSLIFGVFLPAYEWGPLDKPHMKFVVATYAMPLSTRDSRKCRNLIQSDWYKRRWPGVIISSDQNEKMKFENTKFGIRSALSFAGQLTGERGDRFLFDDPHNVKDGESDVKREERVRTFREAVTTRINDPENSSIMGIMQRVHEGDVSGEILSKELGYVHLMLPMEFEPERRCYSPIKPSTFDSVREEVTWSPRNLTWKPRELFDPEEEKALASQAGEPRIESYYSVDNRFEEDELLFPERFPRWTVERDKRVMGTYASDGQLQQRPGNRKGNIFQREWFEIVQAHEIPLPKTTVRRWDLAATEQAIGKDPDATASCKMSVGGDGRFYIELVTEDWLSPAGVETLIVNSASQDGPSIQIGLPQDPGQAGKSQAALMVKKLSKYTVHIEAENKSVGSKGHRAGPFASQAEHGNILLVEGDWNESFLTQVTKFPNAKHDDMLDAATGAFRLLELYSTSGLLDYYAQQVANSKKPPEKIDETGA